MLPWVSGALPWAGLAVGGGPEGREGRKEGGGKAVGAGESNSVSFSNLSSGHLSEEPAGGKK